VCPAWLQVRRPGGIDNEEPAVTEAPSAAAPPMPVPVVKQGPLTVGEMLRASMAEAEEGEGEQAAAWQGPLYAPGPAAQPEARAAAPALPPGTVVAKGPIPVLKPARLAQGAGAKDAELAQWR
jgi:hypothetical protein